MSGVYGGSSATAVISPPAIRAAKGEQKTSIGNTVETTIITAGVNFRDLYGLIVANTGVTATAFNVRSQTGGAILATVEVPAGDTRGFMLPADSSIDQAVAASPWTGQATSSTNLEITALYVENGP